jgi:hypothetical protein
VGGGGEYREIKNSGSGVCATMCVCVGGGGDFSERVEFQGGGGGGERARKFNWEWPEEARGYSICTHVCAVLMHAGSKTKTNGNVCMCVCVRNLFWEGREKEKSVEVVCVPVCGGGGTSRC